MTVAYPSHLANTTVDIQDTTQTQDAIGGMTNSWASVYSAVPARVQPQGGSEPVIAGAKRGTQRAQVFVDAATYTVLPRYRVVWGSVTFKITGIPKRLQGDSGVLRIDVEEVTP